MWALTLSWWKSGAAFRHRFHRPVRTYCAPLPTHHSFCRNSPCKIICYKPLYCGALLNGK